jgi:hypothetical protein
MVAAAACAIALSLAAQASAATLRGTVVGAPANLGGRVSVPVLVRGASVSEISIPARRSVRTKNGRVTAVHLRIGDRVSAQVARVARRVRATSLRVGARGRSKSFLSLSRARAAALNRVTQAAGEVDKINSNPMSLLSPDDPAKSQDELRQQLMDVRYGINLLVADMRSDADGIDAAVKAIKAVSAHPAALIAQLTDTSSGERKAADALAAATAKLDQYINDVGGASSPSAGINEVGTVSDILHAVLELLRTPASS